MGDIEDEVTFYKKRLGECRHREGYFAVRGAYVTSGQDCDSVISKNIYLNCHIQHELKTSATPISPGTAFNLSLSKEMPSHDLLIKTSALGFIFFESEDHAEDSFSSSLHLDRGVFDELFDDIKNNLILQRFALSIASHLTEPYGYWDLTKSKYALVGSIRFEYGNSRQSFRGDE